MIDILKNESVRVGLAEPSIAYIMVLRTAIVATESLVCSSQDNPSANRTFLLFHIQNSVPKLSHIEHCYLTG